jgi:2-oxoglutarate ferredoxin oxidoreductase subunit alpha
VVDRNTPHSELQPKEYKRYYVNGSYVSPIATPGTPNGQYTATGLEHNEYGEPAYGSDTHVQMSEKRWRKYEALRHSHAYVRHFGPERAKVGLLCWGTTAGVCRGAIFLAEQEKLPISMLQVQMVTPLPVDAISAFMDSVDVVLVPEVNYQGQFARLVKGELCRPVVSLTQYTGMPFTRLSILKKAKELMGVAAPELV